MLPNLREAGERASFQTNCAIRPAQNRSFPLRRRTYTFIGPTFFHLPETEAERLTSQKSLHNRTATVQGSWNI